MKPKKTKLSKVERAAIASSAERSGARHWSGDELRTT